MKRPVGLPLGGLGALVLLVSSSVAFSGRAAQDPRHPTIKERLYYADSGDLLDKTSTLFRVDLDSATGSANLTELVVLGPGAAGATDPGWDNVDVLAVTPDGRKLFFADDGVLSNPNGRMGSFDLTTGTITDIGLVEFSDTGTIPVGASWLDQAAFAPDGTLYITNTDTDSLYTVDLSTAFATQIGPVVSNGITLNVAGADITFGADGTLFIWINLSKPNAPHGLYRVTSIRAPGNDVNASLLGGTGLPFFTGMGVRARGLGNLIVSNRPLDVFEIIDRNNGAPLDIFSPIFNGSLFALNNGDMAPSLECQRCRGDVSHLTLRYDGTTANAHIRVFRKKGDEPEDVFFDGIVQPGDSFAFTGTGKRLKLGNSIKVEVNGQVDTNVHTDCSRRIGPGLTSGNFEVVASVSTKGGPICRIIENGCDDESSDDDSSDDESSDDDSSDDESSDDDSSDDSSDDDSSDDSSDDDSSDDESCDDDSSDDESSDDNSSGGGGN